MRGCMLFDYVNLPPPLRPRPTRTRLVGISNGKTDSLVPQNTSAEIDSASDIAMQPTYSMDPMTSIDEKSLPAMPPFALNGKGTTDPPDDDISRQSTAHLMQLSGMMNAIRMPRQDARTGNSQSISNDGDYNAEEGYWPYGIQQTGPLPVVNLYGREPFGRTLPRTT